MSNEIAFSSKYIYIFLTVQNLVEAETYKIQLKKLLIHRTFKIKIFICRLLQPDRDTECFYRKEEKKEKVSKVFDYTNIFSQRTFLNLHITLNHKEIRCVQPLIKQLNSGSYRFRMGPLLFHCFFSLILLFFLLFLLLFIGYF